MTGSLDICPLGFADRKSASPRRVSSFISCLSIVPDLLSCLSDTGSLGRIDNDSLIVLFGSGYGGGTKDWVKAGVSPDWHEEEGSLGVLCRGASDDARLRTWVLERGSAPRRQSPRGRCADWSGEGRSGENPHYHGHCAL